MYLDIFGFFFLALVCIQYYNFTYHLPSDLKVISFLLPIFALQFGNINKGDSDNTCNFQLCIFVT
jgi:hypothetical protein